jgi:hypothetical protein
MDRTPPGALATGKTVFPAGGIESIAASSIDQHLASRSPVCNTQLPRKPERIISFSFSRLVESLSPP